MYGPTSEMTALTQCLRFHEGHSLAEMFVGRVQAFQLGMGNFSYDVLQIMD